MPRQVLVPLDYFAPLAAFLAFAVLTFLSALGHNFLLITPKDDRTVFEQMGVFKFRMGPRRPNEARQTDQIGLEKF